MTTRATTAMDTDDKARQASSPRAAFLQAQRRETGGDGHPFVIALPVVGRIIASC